MDFFGAVGPPRRERPAVAPDNSDGWFRELGGEGGVVDVEPVLVDRDGFGRVEIRPEVAQLGVAGLLAPQQDAGRVIHCLRRRFLVVARVERSGPRRPRMTGIRIERPQERELRIAAIAVRRVFDDHFDHRTPVGRPLRVVLCDRRGGHDVVTPVEVVVVHHRGRGEGFGLGKQGVPGVVVGEELSGVAWFEGEPRFE